MTGSPDDIVGHKTFDTGTLGESGFPLMRHEPLTRREADALWEACERAREDRAARMPDEQAAIRVLFDAWQRLKELGWNDGKYSPRNGTHFRAIELGSTGIFDCVCDGDWPDCTWTTFDGLDTYPSSQAPAMFRLYPEDEAAYKARMKEAAERYQTERTQESE